MSAEKTEQLTTMNSALDDVWSTLRRRRLGAAPVSDLTEDGAPRRLTTRPFLRPPDPAEPSDRCGSARLTYRARRHGEQACPPAEGTCWEYNADRARRRSHESSEPSGLGLRRRHARELLVRAALRGRHHGFIGSIPPRNKARRGSPSGDQRTDGDLPPLRLRHGGRRERPARPCRGASSQGEPLARCAGARPSSREGQRSAGHLRRRLVLSGDSPR